MNNSVAQAELLIIEGELKQAGEILSSILEDEPDNLEAILFQGIVFTETRQEDKAVKALEYYLSREKENPEAWEAMGCAWFRKGDNQKGKDYLEKALSMNPSSGSILRNLGIIEEVSGNHEVSYPYLEKAYRSNPEDYRTLYALGYSCLNRHNNTKAREYFGSLLALSVPEDMRREVVLIQLKLQLGWM